MLGIDTGSGCALEHIANAELQLRVLGVADGHNETPFLSVHFAIHEQVESEVMVGAIVHLVAPDPGAALDRFDLALPADAGGGLF